MSYTIIQYHMLYNIYDVNLVPNNNCNRFPCQNRIADVCEMLQRERRSSPFGRTWCDVLMCVSMYYYVCMFVCSDDFFFFFCVHCALCSVLPMFAVSMSIESACGVCGFLLQTQNIHAAIQSILAVAQPSIQPHQSHNGTLLPILHVTTLKSNKMCIQNSTRIVYNLVHISHIFHTHKAGAK